MTSAHLTGSYDHGLVVLSAVIAVLSSYTALDLAGRLTSARGLARTYWLVGGATAMGIGLWSMHFTAMLAFRLPLQVLYHWPTVLLSLLLRILFFALALFVVSRKKMEQLRALGASLFLGVGLVALHYSSMAAMRLPAMSHYSPSLVALSVAVAIAFSLIFLELTFFFRDELPGRKLHKTAGALLMGAAISVMHYTNMAAASFTPSAEIPDSSHAVSISTIAAADLAFVTLMVLGVALVTCLVDRLQNQTAILDELFEQAPQAVTLMDARNRVVRVNREFTRVFGYTSEECVGRELSDLIIPEECREEERRHEDLVACGQRVEAETIRRRKDGSRLNVSVVRAPVSVPGRLILCYAAQGDISERKRAEEQLKRSEAYLAAGQRLSHTGSWAWNVSTDELFWSQETFRIFGFDPESTIPSVHGTFLARIHPEDRPAIEQGIAEAPAEPHDYAIDYRIVLPDGSIKYIHDVVYPVVNDAGRIIERYGLAMDVTERKQAEEKLQRSLELLRALAARLQRVREEERTTVAREIHDELGQAMTAMKLDLAALMRELPPEEKGAILRVEGLLKLVDETIQSVRRIATDLRPGILDDMGLAAAVEWAAEEFQARTGTACHVSLPDSDIALDPERATALFRIFQETLTNVARHANATEVDVRLARDNGDLFLEVHDNGKGISERELSEGQSLGILGMRERALVLGGELTITGAPGKGTTVNVRIPAATHA